MTAIWTALAGAVPSILTAVGGWIKLLAAYIAGRSAQRSADAAGALAQEQARAKTDDDVARQADPDVRRELGDWSVRDGPGPKP